MKRLLIFLFFFPLHAYDFRGTHYTASYYGCKGEALTDQLYLLPSFIAAVDRSGATLIRISKYTFDNGSVTAVALLSESHASIHTYPEHGSVFVDIFTCGESCNWREFEKTLVEYFGAKKVRRKVRVRK